MDDLAERLHQIESNPSPDLWEDIQHRAPLAADPRRRLRQRVAAGLVAAAVAVGAFAFLVMAFQSEPERSTPATPALEPLEIRVWTTNDPFDVHISASFMGEEIDLDSIETPGPDLEYPKGLQATLPVGTPIVVESSEGSVSVFQLAPARGHFVVEHGSCIIPGALASLPGPAETAFFIFVDGDGYAGGLAFRATTVGDELAHDAALDAASPVDAKTQGLTVCDGAAAGSDPPGATGKDTFAEGSDPLAGPWRVFTEQTEFGPVFGVLIPGQQTFTQELRPLDGRTFGTWSITWMGGDTQLLAQIVAPSVETAEIRLDDGTVIRGALVDLPSDIIGPAQVFVAGFSSEMTVEGQHLDPNGYVVAFEANGEELGRRRLAPLG